MTPTHTVSRETAFHAAVQFQAGYQSRTDQYPMDVALRDASLMADYLAATFRDAPPVAPPPVSPETAPPGEPILPERFEKAGWVAIPNGMGYGVQDADGRELVYVFRTATADQPELRYVDDEGDGVRLPAPDDWAGLTAVAKCLRFA